MIEDETARNWLAGHRQPPEPTSMLTGTEILCYLNIVTQTAGRCVSRNRGIAIISGNKSDGAFKPSSLRALHGYQFGSERLDRAWSG